jgi:ZIP family zinc transporter
MEEIGGDAPACEHRAVRNLGASALWGLAVGSSLVVGAVVAARTSLPPAVAEFVTAFAGGVLLAAIALELVPAADEAAGPAWTAAGLISGTLVYVAADAWLTRDETRKLRRRAAHGIAAGHAMDDEMSALRSAGDHAQAARGESIAVGLFIDGVPESLALGLTVAAGEVGAALAAGIVIGNVVEAYGAAQPIVAGGHSRSFAVGLLAAIGASLAVATVVGGTLLADAAPELVGTAQAVAAGAVLAVVSIQIIPHAFDEVSSEVAIAAIAGFTVGYLLE